MNHHPPRGPYRLGAVRREKKLLVVYVPECFHNLFPGLEETEAMAANAAPSEIIERQRTALLKVLQQDPDSALDALTSRGLISEEEYDTLEKVPDPLKKSRKLLILVQKKGDVTCQCFLKCLFNIFPESASIVLQHENPARQSMRLSTNSEDTFSPETLEITMFSRQKEHLGLETSELFRDKERSCRETVLTSREHEQECDTSKVLYSFEKAGDEVPAATTYLKAGQRYDEPDDSLYLEPRQGPVGCSEHEPIVEEGNCDDLEHLVDDGEEEEYSENMGYASEESSYEDSETDISLEEEEKRMEERKEIFKHILSCLNMDRSRKLLPDYVKQFSLERGCNWTPETPGDLAWNFLMKVQALDVEARDAILRHRVVIEDSKEHLLTGMENLEIRDCLQTINPLDVLCACMLCSDSALQREVMSNMYKCHFALPLLLPDAENNRSILMLGAMSDVVKKLSTQSSGDATAGTESLLSLMKMPVISFVRLGRWSFSKSRILNTLLSPAQKKSHKVFLHQDVSLPVLPRQISDGLVEITWCFPDSHELKESSHIFQKPVAVANLRGDLESFWTQFGFLVEVSSAVFFFTDHLGEREWDLLTFLGEAALGRCFFVLSPRAKDSEEAQIFPRILKLRPSQLLFWEGDESGDRRKSIEALQTALQEVMSSSLTCVSVEDMASLARELGIQLDQDFDLARGVPVSPTEDTARTTEGEKQQMHSQTESSSANQGGLFVSEHGAQGEVSQNAQNFHQIPHVQYPLPLPLKVGLNFNSVSLNAPWVMGTHFESKPRAKWFSPLSFQNTRAHVRGKNFGIHYLKSQRYYSGERFMQLSRASWGCPLNGTFWRAPRPMSQHIWTKRLQTTRPLPSSTAVVSPVGHLHSQDSQLARAVRKPQPGKAHAQGFTETTGNVMRTSHVKYPHHQCFQQPAGAAQKLVRPASHQGAHGMIQRGPSNLVFQPKSHSMSGSKLFLTSQVNCHQPKPSQPVFSLPKPSQTKPPHPQSSQAKPSVSKPPHPQSFQTKPSLSKPTYSQSSPAKPSSSNSTPTHSQSSQAKPFPSKPSQPKLHQSRSKPSQPRPIQPKSSQAKLPRAKAYQARADPKKAGKH